MSQLEKYKQKPSTVFTRLVGVNYGTFTIILEKIETENQKYLAEHAKRKCGIKTSLPLAEQLLLSLLYMRNYETFLKLGHEFGISESYAQKRYTFIKMLLLRSLDLPDEQALKATISGKKIAIDVTEQAIERPVDKQEDYYSGKKSSTPLKFS